MVKKAGTKGANKVSFKKGAWTAEEDRKLAEFVKTHGDNKWKYLPVKAGLNRCGKSCRLRWLNYLRPGIKRGNISEEEEDLILRLHSLLGNRWSLISGRLPGRTDNEIKNHWNTHLSKKALTISQLNQKLSKTVEPISSETYDKIGMVESNCGNNSASPLAYSIPLSSNDQIATNVLPMSNEHNNYHDCFISSRSTWDELPNVDFDLEGFFDLPSSPCFSESIQITELGFLKEKSQSEVIERHSDSIQEVGCKMMANLLDYEADAAFISFFGTHA